MINLKQPLPSELKQATSRHTSNWHLLIVMLFACITSASAMAEAEPDCSTYEEMKTRMLRQERLTPQMQAAQVSVIPAKIAEWDRSMHDFGGESVSGADLYKRLIIATDRDAISMTQEKLREQGWSENRIRRVLFEMKTLAEQKMKQRFATISAGHKLVRLYTGNGVGIVFNVKDDLACIAMRLQDPIVQHYELGLPPFWLKKSSKMPPLIESYRKENGFGVAAFSKTIDGDSLVILAKPQFGAGSSDGPVPYYFGGVMLLESKDGKISNIGDLMHVQYIHEHNFNFPRR